MALEQPSPRVRLKLAQVLVQNLGRPMQALKVLGQIPEGSLPEKLETMRRQLARRAEAMREEGPLGARDEDHRGSESGEYKPFANVSGSNSQSELQEESGASSRYSIEQIADGEVDSETRPRRTRAGHPWAHRA